MSFYPGNKERICRLSFSERTYTHGFRLKMYQIITMISAILLSLLAFASAGSINIVNNCDADFEVGAIYFPTGTGIQCYKMLKLVAGEQTVIDNFFLDEDVVLLKSYVKSNSDSFTYIDTLRNVMGAEEDIDGMCSKLLKSGDIGVYSVEPGVPYLTLCVNEPEPSPEPQPEDIKIANTCAEPLEISFMQYIGDTGVYCSRLQKLDVGKVIDASIQPSLDLLVLLGSGIITTEDIKYVNSLENAISGTTDSFDGFCHDISEGGGGVYTIKDGIKLLELCGPPKPSPVPSPPPKPSPVPSPSPKPSPVPSPAPKPPSNNASINTSNITMFLATIVSIFFIM